MFLKLKNSLKMKQKLLLVTQIKTQILFYSNGIHAVSLPRIIIRTLFKLNKLKVNIACGMSTKLEEFIRIHFESNVRNI